MQSQLVSDNTWDNFTCLIMGDEQTTLSRSTTLAKNSSSYLTQVDYYDLGDKLKPEDFLEERERMMEELIPSTDLLPGVERLLLHLERQGLN